MPVFEAIGILMVIGFLFYNNVFAGFVFFPYILIHVKIRKKQIGEKRKSEISKSFKDAMQSVVALLSAGYSIENAFREALGEIHLMYGEKSYIYQGFATIVRKLDFNTNIEDAFADFAKDCDIEDITAFSEILIYTKKSGGNLIETIGSCTSTICEKIDVKREIDTMISAKRLESNIMNLVPLGIILYMRFTQGDLISKMYSNALGIAVMTACVVVYFTATFIAHKITDIKV